MIEKLDLEKSKALLLLIGGLALIIVIVYYVNKTFGGIRNVVGNITDGLGITDSAETKARKEAVAAATAQAAQVTSPWSPQFYKSAPAGSALITVATANDLAENIWDSVGIFTSDIEEVYGAIKQLRAKSQVSFLADRFYINYKKDLLSWITLQYTKFGKPDSTLATITAYVNGLPNYK